MRNYNEIEPKLDDISPEEAAEFVGKPHLKPQLYQDALLDIFGFSSEAVELNRRGKLTKAQEQALSGELKAENDAMWLTSTIGLGVAVLLAFIFLSEGLPMIYLVMGAGIYLAALLAFSWRRQTKRQDDLRERVEKVRGVPQLRAARQMEGVGPYVLVIEDKMFLIPHAVYEQLADYELPLCQFYYTAKNKTLLSAEIIRQFEPDPKLKNEDLMLDDADEKAKNDDLLLEEDEYEKQSKHGR
jgi:hypothetical protein